MESSSGCSVWFGHRHRGHPEDTGGGFSERGEDFYPAIREDIQLATREDFFMAMDRGPRIHMSNSSCHHQLVRLIGGMNPTADLPPEIPPGG